MPSRNARGLRAARVGIEATEREREREREGGRESIDRYTHCQLSQYYVQRQARKWLHGFRSLGREARSRHLLH